MDVAGTKNEADLFRTDSMRSKLYTAYQRERLQPLLNTTIGECILEMVKPENETNLATDKRLRTLCQLSDGYLNALQKKLETDPTAIPEDLRRIYHTLGVSIGIRNWSVTNQVSSFLFLRVLCPCVAQPVKAGVKTAVQPKNAVDLSKVLNCVACNPSPKDNKGQWTDPLFVPDPKSTEPTYAVSRQPLLIKIADAMQTAPKKN
jgi:hypothetical protein